MPGMELRQAQLSTDGLTDNVFPLTAAKLSETEYQEALKFVARRKNMDRYHSMVDFVFCEFYTIYRFRCFSFYNDKGPSLRDLPGITEEMLNACDLVLSELLLGACMLALNTERLDNWATCGWKRSDWTSVKAVVNQVIRSAA